MNQLLSGKKLAYAGLIFVIVLWGISPLITLQFYPYYSPTIRIIMGSFICAAALLLISWRKRHLLTKQYFLIAIPTGFFMALANILQKIGLQYTTPTHYAFLENLSCLTVPLLLFFFIKIVFLFQIPNGSVLGKIKLPAIGRQSA